jgi:hypothetical protein
MIRINFRNLLLLAASTIILLTSSCLHTTVGTGPAITETREISPFTELTLDIPANITLVIADTLTCVVTAQKNIAELIEFKQKGNVLRINSKNNFNSTAPVEIVLSASQIERLTVNGSGDIHVINTIKADELKLNINGSGDISASIAAVKLSSQINGSGDLVLSGKAGSNDATINGSGNIKANSLSVDDYTINIKGSGDAEIDANTSLNARLIGSGNITYTGAPAVKSEITGSGDISKTNK